jgi:peptidoglycan-N-acetylglucosamine deacetylase
LSADDAVRKNGEPPKQVALSEPAHAAPASERKRKVRKPLASLPFIHSAFIMQEDNLSIMSLRAHIGQLELVFPDWMTFATADGRIVHTVDQEVAQLLRTSDALVMPRITNIDAKGVWFSEGLGKFLRDPAATGIFIDTLKANLAAQGADGVNLDIESIAQTERDVYVAFLRRLTIALHNDGFAVTVDVPVDDLAFDYEAIGQIVDAVVLMVYDQHYQTGKPGPIAGQDWYEDNLAVTKAMIPADKVIVGIGAYGYDWREGRVVAEAIGFTTAVERSKVSGEPITAGDHDVNSHFSYKDNDGQHQVWLLDAVSGWNQYRVARQEKTRGVAIWRTGLEDPGLWSFYRNRTASEKPYDPSVLATIPAMDVASYMGEGEMLRVHSTPAEGRRELSLSGDVIEAADMTTNPRAFEVERLGKVNDKLIALTFDDGPDPQWTPRVLDVLARHNAIATFFVTGKAAMKNQWLLAETFKAGHQIGNHTFDHPSLRFLDPSLLPRELNATQRAIEGITGRSTVLFRPPYDADAMPSSRQQLAPLRTITQLGYVIAGADIDSKDFTQPGTDHIVESVLAKLTDDRSHVVLMHDAGGDRRQTVAALERLIPDLQARGYKFVGLNELMEVKASEVMPEIPASEKPLVMGSLIKHNAIYGGWQLLVVVFAVATVVAVLRMLVLAGLIIAGRFQRPIIDATFTPAVRVLIPGYNEAKVIERTLASVMASDYPNFTVTVIDDGSKDNMADIVRAFAANEPRVSLISQANAGKAAALNNAFAQSPEDYVVTIDADTIIGEQTIRRLMERFADPTIDAVCGNVQVGNVHNCITAFQNIEYVTSQNIDRRAFEAVNGISVVPGATSAWKRAKVLDIGGYSHQTLTEDADLTFALLAAGGKIANAPLATSMTEAPETASTLYRQRFRWSFGNMQCFWKHRRQLGRGSLGLIAMPHMMLFQFLFPLLAPIGDALLVFHLLNGEVNAMVLGYLAFLTLDAVAPMAAFALEGRPPAMPWVILVQRFYYRQFLYVVLFSALFAMLRGGRRGWNKLIRTGNVSQPYGRRASDVVA